MKLSCSHSTTVSVALILASALLLSVPAQSHAQGGAGLVQSEFIFEEAPFKACHASTIVPTETGLLGAWFAGSGEGNPDVSIWMARYDGIQWSEPVEMFNGIQDDENIRYPCWNPVLFSAKNGPLMLFYKLGPSPREWWGMVSLSHNGGESWTDPRRLPNDIYGPIKNKPVQLPNGTILCGSSTEDSGWRVHMEYTHGNARLWTRTRPLHSAMEYGAIQPTILMYTPNRIQILCRSKQDVITQCWSEDQGRTWSRMRKTVLPNPSSGIDAVTLKDGRGLLVYNHSTTGRGVLNVAVTENGKRWKSAMVLEKESGSEFSYPAVVRTEDGLVHVTYTWKRERIKHVVLDPSMFELREMPDGQWVR
jgi:predicted neuraminidase